LRYVKFRRDDRAKAPSLRDFASDIILCYFNIVDGDLVSTILRNKTELKISGVKALPQPNNNALSKVCTMVVLHGYVFFISLIIEIKRCKKATNCKFIKHQ
jgi:hypothetical protein